MTSVILLIIISALCYTVIGAVYYALLAFRTHLPHWAIILVTLHFKAIFRISKGHACMNSMMNGILKQYWCALVPSFLSFVLMGLIMILVLSIKFANIKQRYTAGVISLMCPLFCLKKVDTNMFLRQYTLENYICLRYWRIYTKDIHNLKLWRFYIIIGEGVEKSKYI